MRSEQAHSIRFAAAIPTEALVFCDSYFNLLRNMTIIPDRGLKPLFTYTSGVMDVNAAYDAMFSGDQVTGTAKRNMEQFVHDCISFNCDTIMTLLGQALSHDIARGVGSKCSLTSACADAVRALIRNRTDDTITDCLTTVRYNAAAGQDGFDARAEILAFVDYVERAIIGRRFGHYTTVSYPMAMIMLYLACSFYEVNLSDMRSWWAVTPHSDRVVSISDTTLACIPFSTPMVLACSAAAGPCRTSRQGMEFLANLDRLAGLTTSVKYPHAYCNTTEL